MTGGNDDFFNLFSNDNSDTGSVLENTKLPEKSSGRQTRKSKKPDEVETESESNLLDFENRFGGDIPRSDETIRRDIKQLRKQLANFQETERVLMATSLLAAIGYNKIEQDRAMQLLQETPMDSQRNESDDYSGNTSETGLDNVEEAEKRSKVSILPLRELLQRTDSTEEVSELVRDMGNENREGQITHNPEVHGMEGGTSIWFPGNDGTETESTGTLEIDNAPWSNKFNHEINIHIPFDIRYGEPNRTVYESIESVIPRMGAKTVLRDFLVKHFPKHWCYIEPFGGSFKVLLWKKNRSKVEIINDIDGDLIHFFRYVVYYPDDLADMINMLPVHKGLLDALRNEIISNKLSGLERAAAVYYSNKLSFNGTGSGYAGSVQTAPSAKADRNAFRKIADRLRGIDIRCDNALELIKGCNKTLDPGKYPGGIFFYLDPPYDETAGYKTLRGESTFGKQEQYSLFNLCVEIDKCGNKFIQTNAETDFLKNLYKNFHMITRKVKYIISGSSDAREDVSELIISNFDLEKEAYQEKGTLFGG